MEQTSQKLHLRDFFDAFEKGNPYMLAAISHLNEMIPDEVLNRNQEWFKTWSVAGKRKI